MKRAPLISRDFEEILSAPLEIQIFKKINIKRPPDLVPGGALKGGASNILWTVLPPGLTGAVIPRRARMALRRVWGLREVTP